MRVVVNIPNWLYNAIMECKEPHYSRSLGDAVRDGTPLPKGHGRILDEKDILDTKNNDGGWYDLVDMPEYIAGVKAVIESDKKSGGEVGESE